MKSAVAWAKKRGLSRTNEVHGESEYRVPTEFNFANTEIDRIKSTASSDFDIEARPLFFLP